MSTDISEVIGVDFGTSTSLVFHSGRGARMVPVPIGYAHAWMPSIVGVERGAVAVGEDADNLPGQQLIRSIKSAISARATTVIVNDGQAAAELDVDFVIASLLREVSLRASDQGIDVTTPGAVRLGCPAMWDGEQRRRLIQAAVRAGIAVGDNTLVDEPIAAGVSWIVDRTERMHQNIRGKLLVFDMGGGTLDLAVLDVNAASGEVPEIHVQSASGVGRAGDALDRAIVRDLLSQLESAGVNLKTLPRQDALQDALLRTASEIKLELTSQLDVAVAVATYRDADLPVLKYSREELEAAFRPQLDEAEQLIWAVLRAARTTYLQGHTPDEIRKMPRSQLAAEIDYVLLAGGMSRVPAVSERLGDMFPRADIYTTAGVDPQELVAAGLSETIGYDRLNLHRPGFDFVLEWADAETGQVRRETLYTAYTPFYEPWEALSRNRIDYQWRSPLGLLPRRGQGILRVVSVQDGPINMAVNGTEAPGLAVAFGHGEVVLTLATNGRVSVRDGQGIVQVLRVEKWPVLRGRDHAVLRAKNLEAAGEQARLLRQLPWHQQPYD